MIIVSPSAIKPRHDERDGSAQIGRHDRGAGEALDAFDGGGIAVELDVGAEPRQFLHVHEAVLEDCLADHAGAAGRGHQRHKLRLQVGRESGERLRLYRNRLDTSAIARDAHAAVGLLDRDFSLRQRVQRRLQEIEARTLERHVAAGRGNCNGERARLDAIGEHGVHGALEPVCALDPQRGGADAFDLHAHLDEALGNVTDLRLARGVLDDGLPARQRRGEQHVVGGANRDLGEHDAAAAQAAGRGAIT